MPRRARIDAPGALHHVIVRGIERKKIFRSDCDKNNLLNRLSDLIPQTQTDCFAWALMPNHFHLLLRTGSVPIAVLMGRLLTGYAGWFNKKYKRHGQLFQNRYKSFLCQEEIYFKELLRYIHLNPLRAGIVANLKELDKHPWSGHSVLMNNNEQGWQNIESVCTLFAGKIKLARKRYRSFVEKGVGQGRRPDLTGGGLLRSFGGWKGLKELRKSDIRVKGDERILGDSDFVENVLKAADERLEQRFALSIQGYDFQRTVQRVAQVLDITPEEVTAFGKSPRTVQARALLCYWAHRKLGMTTVEIAAKLSICQSAVSRLSMKGEKQANEQKFKLIEIKS
jgi:REP element-mobilizing transposase RayT